MHQPEPRRFFNLCYSRLALEMTGTSGNCHALPMNQLTGWGHAEKEIRIRYCLLKSLAADRAEVTKGRECYAGVGMEILRFVRCESFPEGVHMVGCIGEEGEAIIWVIPSTDAPTIAMRVTAAETLLVQQRYTRRQRTNRDEC